MDFFKGENAFSGVSFRQGKRFFVSAVTTDGGLEFSARNLFAGCKKRLVALLYEVDLI